MDERTTSDVVIVEKNCDHAGGVSNTDKWIIAAILGAIFVLLASPFFFSIINYFLKPLGFPATDEGRKPTVVGLIVAAIVFFLIVRLLMH
jgi:hypothetical protein